MIKNNNKLLKLTSLIGLLFLCSSQIFAQSKWHKSISFGVNHSISKSNIIPYDSKYAKLQMPAGKGLGLNLDATINREIFNNFTLGLGMSLNSIKILDQGTMNSTPIYATLNYNIPSYNKNYPFLFADYGYAIPFSRKLNSGRHVSIGAGYVFQNRMKIQLQWIQQNSEGTSFMPDNRTIIFNGGRSRFNNIALKFGFVF